LDALLAAFLAAALGEWGDKSQLAAALLAARYARPGAVLAGIAVAALANSALAAFGGSLIHVEIVPRAASLLLAVALLYSGVVGLIGPEGRAPRFRFGAFAGSAIAFFLAGWGGRTPFVTAAIAAQFGVFPLAAAGAAAGTLLSAAPAVALAGRFGKAVPLKPIRLAAAGLFLIAGLWLGVSALRLV
jgi:putative Ca2+/H+ antiporter (TMEM165/GDT1 family)